MTSDATTWASGTAAHLADELRELGQPAQVTHTAVKHELFERQAIRYSDGTTKSLLYSIACPVLRLEWDGLTLALSVDLEAATMELMQEQPSPALCGVVVLPDLGGATHEERAMRAGEVGVLVQTELMRLLGCKPSNPFHVPPTYGMRVELV